jgi:hypothetical protein
MVFYRKSRTQIKNVGEKSPEEILRSKVLIVMRKWNDGGRYHKKKEDELGGVHNTQGKDEKFEQYFSQ